jgi:hypothetical protein
MTEAAANGEHIDAANQMRGNITRRGKASWQTWGRQVAYSSQFLDRDNRAHRGKAKIKSRLIADLDPDEWEFPPKPKWMRWRTYNRYEAYEKSH